MIQPTYGVLQTLFADRVFRIPHYQRFYSWQTQQRDDLFDDIRKLARQDEQQHHFMATLVCYRTAETKSVGAHLYRIFDIVDGQQRLTTLIILLKCIELALPDGSVDRGDLGKILVKRDDHLILLQTNNANDRIFNRFVREGKAPTDDDVQIQADRNLARAIKECSDFVETWKSGGGIQKLMRLVLHRLGFVIHDTEDEQAVYTVFEVLNSRGLDVNWLDKAKSMLMGKAFEMRKSKAAGEAAIKELQNLWGQIYRELAREDVPSDELLRVTVTLHFGPGAGKVRSAQDSLKEFGRQCDTIEEPRQFSEWLLDCAKRLTLLQQQRLGPVIDILHARLLAVAIMSANGVDERERKMLMDEWERVTFRIFGFNGLDARRLVGEYARLGSDIVQRDENKGSKPLTYSEIRPRLIDLGAKYPIAEAVQIALAREDWYDDPELCRYVLWQYEEHLAEKAGAGATVNAHDRDAIWKTNASDSIEHIFPQSKSSPQGWIGKMCRKGQSEEPLDKHVGRIGNLVLLPKKLNSKASTKPFVDKKVEYAKHGLRMMQSVCSQNDWTLDQIETREAEIMNWAMTRWADL